MTETITVCEGVARVFIAVDHANAVDGGEAGAQAAHGVGGALRVERVACLHD